MSQITTSNRSDNWGFDSFGSPLQNTPAFQREWRSLSTSVSALSGLGGEGVSLIDAPSAIRPDASGSIHLWGLAATTDGNGALAGLLKQNNNSGQIITAVACQVNGPFFMAFDAPVKLPLNASLYWDELAVTGTYPFISVFYTIMWEKGRK